MNTTTTPAILDIPHRTRPNRPIHRIPQPLPIESRLPPFHRRTAVGALLASLPAWSRAAIGIVRDLLLAAFVTLVFLSPMLAFAAAPFTLEWTLGVAILTVVLTVAGRRRAAAIAIED